MIVNAGDTAGVKVLFLAESFVWDSELKEFRSPSGVPVQFLIAGQQAGKGSEVKIPEPEGEPNMSVLNGLFVVRLSRLIEMKFACCTGACGIGSIRRTHRDFADVVELIAI